MNIQQSATLGLGSLDPTFGDNGQLILTSPNPRHDQITPWAIGVDSSHRIYVAGEALDLSTHYDYYCVRLNSNGQVDTSFGQAGYVIGSFENGESAKAREVLVLDDNKILLIGTSGNSKAVLRLNPDGSPDISFGKGGIAIIPLGGEIARPAEGETAAFSASGAGGTSGSTVLPDGKLLLVDRVTTGQNIGHTVAIRLNTNGSLDSQFNGTGFVQITYPGADVTALFCSLEHDGRYVLAGAAYWAGKPSSALFIRLLPSGAIDTAFASNGYLVVPSGIATGFYIDKLILQSNRRLLGIGYTWGGRFEGLLISREMDGSANIQFNNGNPVMESNGSRKNHWTNATIQSDGNILVHGSSFDAQTGEEENAVARYTDAGRLDTSFGQYGRISFPMQQASRPAAWFTGNTVLFLGKIKVDSHFGLYCIARGVIG